MNKTIFVTGGAGFIGSHLVEYLTRTTPHTVVNIDKLTYAGAAPAIAATDKYFFEKVDICDDARIAALFAQYKPDLVMHLAAESHVDRSISGPAPFIQSNIVGTFVLLNAARQYWDALPAEKKSTFRFHHVSTDEVYGDLGPEDPAFSEETPYAPSSPYSASKASSDHLVRAWNRTYGLPCVITNCSNNYGPRQYPEKLIPTIIHKALEGKPLPVYGSGLQIRDWLYVTDHVEALWLVAQKGQDGETYNIGGLNEMKNIDVVKTICDLLEDIHPIKPAGVSTYAELITHVADRPGHDQRYAINCDKIARTLGWSPSEDFQSGMRKTVEWYVAELTAQRKAMTA